MRLGMQAVLLTVLAALLSLDISWQRAVHFPVDPAPYYAAGVVVLCFWAASFFYTFIRKDGSPAAMLFALGYLIPYSLCGSTFTYFALTLHGHRIDNILAAADRAVGINWIELMRWAANHPLVTDILGVAYYYAIYQLPLLMVIAGVSNRPDIIWRSLFAVSIASLTTIFFWAVFPSFGAFSVYDIPQDIAFKLKLVLDSTYGHALGAMLHQMPRDITPYSVKGLVGFPSFHAIESLLVTFYLRPWRYLFFSALIFNAVAIAATPIQGGHHVMDIVGGIIVAVAAIIAARFICNWIDSAVKEPSAQNSARFTDAPVLAQLPTNAAGIRTSI
jgi:hypothetical protein